MNILKAVGAVVGFLLVVFALNFLGNAWGLWSYSFWEPKREDARREVFEHTASFIQAKKQVLNRLYVDWTTEKDSIAKQALCNMARHEASLISRDDYPDNLLSWECIR